MYVTEKEAAARWCPHAFRAMPEEPHYQQPFVANRREDGAPAVACIGSRCMWWRWFTPELSRRFLKAPDTSATKEPARPTHVPETWEWSPFDAEEADPAGWLEPKEETNARRRGMCGAVSALGVP